MANPESPFMRLFLFSQNKFKRWHRRKSSSPSSSLVHQVRGQRQSNTPTVAALAPSHVAENLRQDEGSDNAGPAHVAAASTPSEDALLPQRDNQVVRRASVVTPTGEDESRQALGVPTITITGPEERESVEPNSTTTSTQQVSSRPDGPSLRSPQRRTEQPQRPGGRYIRRRPLGTPAAGQSLGTSPPRRARERTSSGLSPRDAERARLRHTAFPEDAGVRPVFSLSTAATSLMGSPNHAGRRTERPMEGSSGTRRRTQRPVEAQVGSSNITTRRTQGGMVFRRGSPAVLAIRDHEYLIRFENVIENARNIFTGLDIEDDQEIRIDALGSVASGSHRTVAAGGDLWLIRIVTQLDESGETTRLRTPPGSGSQTRDTSEADERSQDDARHENDSDSSGETIRPVEQPRRSSNVSNTDVNEALVPRTIDGDIQPVDPQPTPDDHSHEAVNAETISVENPGLQLAHVALDARDSLVSSHASPPSPARISPHVPPPTAAELAPLQPDVPMNVVDSPTEGSHANSEATPGHSLSYPSIPSLPSLSDVSRETPGPQFAEVLTESPKVMSQQELDFAPLHARHLNTFQASPPSHTEQTTPQASPAAWPSPENPNALSQQELDFSILRASHLTAFQGSPSSPMEQTIPQASQAAWPSLANVLGLTTPGSPHVFRRPQVRVTNPFETQQPPLIPPGLALAMNRSPAQNAPNPMIKQAAERWGAGIPFPRLASPVISPAFASPFIQRPPRMGPPLALTPAGYPHPIQTQHIPTNDSATAQWPQPLPQAPDSIFFPTQQAPEPVFRRTIRRPQPATPPPTRPRPRPRSLPLSSESMDTISSSRIAAFSPFVPQGSAGAGRTVDILDGEDGDGVAQSGRIPWDTKGKWKPKTDIFGLQAYPGNPVPRLMEVRDWIEHMKLTTTVGCPPLPPRPHGGTLANAYGTPRIGLTAREYFMMLSNDEDENTTGDS